VSEAVRYLCVARLNGIDRVFLWEGHEPGPSRVVVDAGGLIRSFPTAAAAAEAVALEQWNVSPEDPQLYDLDRIEGWCRSEAAVRDFSELLSGWNLLLDLPDGENVFRAADARARGLYDKLFKSCNLPSMTSSAGHVEPTWTQSETAALKHVFLLGLAEFRSRFR